MSRNPEDIDAESLLLSKPGQGTCINAGGLHEVTRQRNEVDELHVAVPVAREHATPPPCSACPSPGTFGSRCRRGSDRSKESVERAAGAHASARHVEQTLLDERRPDQRRNGDPGVLFGS